MMLILWWWWSWSWSWCWCNWWWWQWCWWWFSLLPIIWLSDFIKYCILQQTRGKYQALVHHPHSSASQPSMLYKDTRTIVTRKYAWKKIGWRAERSVTKSPAGFVRCSLYRIEGEGVSWTSRDHPSSNHHCSQISRRHYMWLTALPWIWRNQIEEIPLDFVKIPNKSNEEKPWEIFPFQPDNLHAISILSRFHTSQHFHFLTFSAPPYIQLFPIEYIWKMWVL